MTPRRPGEGAVGFVGHGPCGSRAMSIDRTRLSAGQRPTARGRTARTAPSSTSTLSREGLRAWRHAGCGLRSGLELGARAPPSRRAPTNRSPSRREGSAGAPSSTPPLRAHPARHQARKPPRAPRRSGRSPRRLRPERPKARLASSVTVCAGGPLIRSGFRHRGCLNDNAPRPDPHKPRPPQPQY